jgi:hypothetical protein
VALIVALKEEVIIAFGFHSVVFLFRWLVKGGTGFLILQTF